jgi:hypothetical protein
MSESKKRTIQVNVRMNEGDFQLLNEAASKLWPEAILSNSGILLGLARIAAREILEHPKKKRTAIRTPSKSSH